MLPRWFKWLFIAFIGYLLFLGNRASHEVAQPTVSPSVPAISEKNYPALSSAMDVQRWKSKLNPEAPATDCATPKDAPGLSLKIIDELTGNGVPAECGDAVPVHLTVWNGSGGIAYTGDHEFQLGSHAIHAALDAGLVGLRPGGTRTLILPAEAATPAKSSAAVPATLRAAFPAHKIIVVTVTRPAN